MSDVICVLVYLHLSFWRLPNLLVGFKGTPKGKPPLWVQKKGVRVFCPRFGGRVRGRSVDEVCYVLLPVGYSSGTVRFRDEIWDQDHICPLLGVPFAFYFPCEEQSRNAAQESFLHTTGACGCKARAVDAMIKLEVAA